MGKAVKTTDLRNVPSNLSFFRAFIMKGCWFWSRAFSPSIDYDDVVFVLDSVYVLYCTY
jgi:hypothetical protein